LARKVIAPTGSRRRRWLFLCTTAVAVAVAVLFIPSAFAVHDNGVFELDGNAITASGGQYESTPPAAEDWDMICKANKVQIGTLSVAITSTSATTITVNETRAPKIEPVNIQVDSEQMTVTLRSGATSPFTYTVTRGINGTTKATHLANAPVYSGCLFNPGATVPSGATVSNPSSFVVDPSNSSNDDILKGGTKDDNDITSWKWTSSGSLDKDDLTNGGAAEYTCSDASANCGANHGSDKLIYFFADRYGISGSSNVAFWFFQKNVLQQANQPNGTCTISAGCPFVDKAGNPVTHKVGNISLGGSTGAGCNPNPDPVNNHCTAGDILVIGAFGPHATLNVFEWVGAGNATKNFNGTNSCFTAACSLQPIYQASNGDCSAVGNGDNGCAVANTVATPSPWILPQKNIQGKDVSNSFNANATKGYSSLFEGGLNLTGLGLGGACFSSFLVNSRASAAGDSELHDKLLGSFQRCSPSASTQVKNGNGVNTNGTIQPGTPVHDTATITVSGASTPDDATGTVDFYMCGPDANAAPNCDGTTGHVGTLVTSGAALSDTSNPANTTDGISGASSGDVNASGSPLGNGYYCFRAEFHLTNYDNPDPFTDGTNECFQVLKLSTTITTDPETCSGNPSVCVTNTGPFALKDGATIIDHAVVTGAAGGGFPEGTVSFYLCGPSEVSGSTGSEVCAIGDGTKQGADATLTHVANETIKSEATSAGFTVTSTTTLGVYCYRAVYHSTSAVYDGVDDANTHSECFTVTNAASASSTQDWLPNDHVTITADASSIAGTLSIQLIKGTLGATCAASTGTVKYTEPVPNGGAFTATSSGATYDTTNATFKVAVADAGDYFWRIVFTPTSSFAGGAVTKCETSSVSINNNP
jgi:hypothetical protein